MVVKADGMRSLMTTIALAIALTGCGPTPRPVCESTTSTTVAPGHAHHPSSIDCEHHGG